MVREYLIVAFWTFDQNEDSIKMTREYTVDRPFAPRDNVRPLYTSVQAECAFWFESSKSDDLIYCEVSLLNDGEPTRTAIRLNAELR